jgi:hypothetical protein
VNDTERFNFLVECVNATNAGNFTPEQAKFVKAMETMLVLDADQIRRAIDAATHAPAPELDPKDLRIDTFRISQGAMHEYACEITYVPTGLCARSPYMLSPYQARKIARKELNEQIAIHYYQEGNRK